MKIFCSDCKHVKICKHFEYLMRNPELTLGGCRMFESFLKEQVETHNPPRMFTDTNANDNITLLRALKDEPPVMKADSKDVLRLLNFEKKEQPKEVYPELKICNECGGKTYGELVKCDECGTELCSACAFFDDLDMDSLEATKWWCQKCYEELFADELDVEEEESTSLFEILTSTLQKGDE